MKSSWEAVHGSNSSRCVAAHKQSGVNIRFSQTNLVCQWLCQYSVSTLSLECQWSVTLSVTLSYHVIIGLWYVKW